MAASTSVMEILSEGSKIVRHGLASGTMRPGDLEIWSLERLVRFRLTMRELFFNFFYN